MKEEINTVLAHLNCEGEMLLLRNQILSLSASHSTEIQKIIVRLLDAIHHTNIQSHKYAGYYYLFLGCAYYELGEYQNAVINLKNAITEMWGMQVNKSLACWILGLCYSNMQDFPNAHHELQEALQLLATQRGTNSPRTEREHRSRQTIRQNIKEAFERLFNESLFRAVQPDPVQKADRFPVQNPPTDKEDAGVSISLEMPISVTNENYPAIYAPVTVTNENNPVNKLSFTPPSPDVTPEKIYENTEKHYENRTDDEGYLVIRIK